MKKAMMRCVYIFIALLSLSSCVVAMDETLPYDALPEITLATDVKLIASPNHPTSYLSEIAIPAGEKVDILGGDADAAWLLVRHEGVLGWMPSIFSGTNVATLPQAITLEPLPEACIYLDSIFDLNDAWISTITGDAIVIGSLYRSAPSEAFDDAELQIDIADGGYAVEADYLHTFLTEESAFILFGYSVANLHKGSSIGFFLDNAGDEPLELTVSVFSGDCQTERLTDLVPVGQIKTIDEPVVAEATVDVDDKSFTTVTVTNGRPRSTPSPAGSHAKQSEGEIRPLGALWEADGVVMNFTRLELRAGNDPGDAAIRAWFVLFNNTGQRLLVDIDWNNIYFEDSFGIRYVDWDGGGLTSTWLNPGASYFFDRYYTIEPRERSRVPASAEYIQAHITEFSRIQNARWQFAINPMLSPLNLEDFAETKEIGETWEVDGLRITVTDTEIRTLSDREDAAARVWFNIENMTNESMLVELDLGRIYLTDSFGRRFSDWDGGGFWSFSLNSGESRSFDRYYSEMAGTFSRITRGSEFVVIQAFEVGRVPQTAWYIPIVR
jgi:hypothetical protein